MTRKQAKGNFHKLNDELTIILEFIPPSSYSSFSHINRQCYSIFETEKPKFWNQKWIEYEEKVEIKRNLEEQNMHRIVNTMRHAAECNLFYMVLPLLIVTILGMSLLAGGLALSFSSMSHAESWFKDCERNVSSIQVLNSTIGRVSYPECVECNTNWNSSCNNFNILPCCQPNNSSTSIGCMFDSIPTRVKYFFNFTVKDYKEMHYSSVFSYECNVTECIKENYQDGTLKCKITSYNTKRGSFYQLYVYKPEIDYPLFIRLLPSGLVLLFLFLIDLVFISLLFTLFIGFTCKRDMFGWIVRNKLMKLKKIGNTYRVRPSCCCFCISFLFLKSTDTYDLEVSQL
ncbi:hypothetical protein NAEGRDRAFT_74843 [Naegleria gruberi]|uniref:Uncharacterized protein n=1 Tax=Naegleria gruberi TaxID=5762 RepID=D2W0F9_NAEGR|nr:uncharacterized protein NAEGRDRAFT_74843 [Naegleria gruberi]EFC37424.1 hypothetical protein NAEGRDRAFT_74843 [Naegleria gruberi]|eukprot:XP_002670168.1 hypothetical protein NAEGRDRAFT_74843 [Naegleria gruberi strain NEG-M]